MNQNHNQPGDASCTPPSANGQNQQAAPEVLEARDTNFIGSVPDQQTVYPIDPKFDSQIVMDPTKQLSISSFLSRPQDVHSGTIGPLNPGVRLYTSDCLRAVARIPVWAEKMRGVFSFTATTVVRVVINAPPNVAGRLCVTFDPNNTTSSYDMIYRSDNFLHYTQRHNVQLDFQDKSCILKIPYCSIYNSYNLTTAVGDVGTFSIFLMNPMLSNVDSSLVHYTVYLSYEDVKLGPPTLLPVNTTDSGLTFSTLTFQSLWDRIRKSAKDPRALLEGSDLKFSTIANAVGNVSMAAGAIPQLAPVAIPVSIVTRFFGSMLQHFGFSKIVDTASFTNVWNNPLRHWFSSNGGDYSVSLGYDVDNQVPVSMTVTNTENDEMSIRFLSSIPVTTDKFSFDNLFDRGELIAFGFVTPYNTQGTGFRNAYELGGNILLLTPFGVLNRTHHFWRGDMCYKLTSVKTKFHTGRLLVTWDPANTIVGNPTYDDAQAYSYKMLWDLSETNEVVFKVPFYQTSAWASRSPASDSYPNNNGIVRVWVVNPLLGTDNVSTSIDILTSCWIENEAFASPTNGGAPFLEESFVFQSIWSTTTAAETYIGGSTPFKYPAEELTIGECNLTIKNYMLTPQLYYSFTPVNNSETILPVYGLVYANSTTNQIPAGADGFSPSVHDLFSSAYAYRRGSYRTLINNQGLERGYSPIKVSNVSRFFSATTPTLAFSGPLVFLSQVPSRTIFANDELPVRLPMYCPTLGYDRKTSIYPGGSLINPSINAGLRIPSLLLTKDSEPQPTFVDIYRAGGDDFRLHMFRGFYKVLEGF